MVAKISRVVPVAEENLKRPSVKPAADDDYRSAAGIRRRASVYSIGRITVDDPGTMEGQLARYFKASHALAASGESRGDSGSSLIFRDTVLEFAFVSKTLKDFQNSALACFALLTLVTTFFALMDYIDDDLIQGIYAAEMLIPRTLMPLFCVIATIIAGVHNKIFLLILKHLKYRRGPLVVRLVNFQYWSYVILGFLNLMAITPLYFFKLDRFRHYVLEKCVPLQMEAEALNSSLPVLTAPILEAVASPFYSFTKQNIYDDLAPMTQRCLLTEVFHYTSSERNIYVGVISLYAGTSLALPIRFRENIWMLLPSVVSLCIIIALERARFPVYAIGLFNFLIEDAIFSIVPLIALSLLLLLAIYHRESRGRREFILEKIVQMERLRKAEEEVERNKRVNDMRMKFFSNVAHEIRTPIHGIRGLADLLLQSGELSEGTRTYVDAINGSGDTIHGIINDILDLVKMEATEFKLKDGEFNPLKTAERAVSTLYPNASKKGVELVCNADSSADMTLLGDEARFVQVINNLLSNSIKFSDAGSTVVLQVWIPPTDDELEFASASGSDLGGRPVSPPCAREERRKAALIRSAIRGGDEASLSEKGLSLSDEVLKVDFVEEKGKGMNRKVSKALRETTDDSVRTRDEDISRKVTLYLRISDEGIGIPKKLQGRLFQRFFQALDTDSNKVQGSGLGLSIVSELCKLMGGSIKVDSVEGIGSEFTAWFQLEKTNRIENRRLSDSSTSLIPSRLELSGRKPTMTQREINAQLRLNGIPETLFNKSADGDGSDGLLFNNDELDKGHGNSSGTLVNSDQESSNTTSIAQRRLLRLSADGDPEKSTDSGRTIQPGRAAIVSPSKSTEGEALTSPSKAAEDSNVMKECAIFCANMYIRELFAICYEHLAFKMVPSEYLDMLTLHEKRVNDIKKRRTGGKGGTEAASLALPSLDHQKMRAALLADQALLKRAWVAVFDVTNAEEGAGRGRIGQLLSPSVVNSLRGRQIVVFVPPTMKLTNVWEMLGSNLITVSKPVTSLKLKKTPLQTSGNNTKKTVLPVNLKKIYTRSATPESAYGSDGSSEDEANAYSDEKEKEVVAPVERKTVIPQKGGGKKTRMNSGLPVIEESQPKESGTPRPRTKSPIRNGPVVHTTASGSVTTGGSTRGRPGKVHGLEEKRILLVDDDKLNHVILRGILVGLGALGKKIAIATNGQEALAMIEDQDYDLVFMDYHMPLVDGPEAAQAIRQKGKRMPIIGMTAAVDQSEIQDLLSAGMNHCICKPFDKTVVRAALTEVFEAFGPSLISGRASPIALEPLRGPASVLARGDGSSDMLLKSVHDEGSWDGDLGRKSSFCRSMDRLPLPSVAAAIDGPSGDYILDTLQRRSSGLRGLVSELEAIKTPERQDSGFFPTFPRPATAHSTHSENRSMTENMRSSFAPGATGASMDRLPTLPSSPSFSHASQAMKVSVYVSNADDNNAISASATTARNNRGSRAGLSLNSPPVRNGGISPDLKDIEEEALNN